MLSLKNVCKNVTNSKKESVKVLSNINLEIRQGDFVCIQGPTGSSKSALLSVLSASELKFEGEYYIDGIELSKYTSKQLSVLRMEKFGIVPQQIELLDKYTIADNIGMILKYAKVSKADKQDYILKALNNVGLHENVANLKPADLSCGQKQMVMIARALVLNPKVIVADCPTTYLDEQHTIAILNLFSRLNKEGVTIIMVSDDDRFLQKAKRVFTMNRGMLVENMKVTRGRNIGEVIDINKHLPKQKTPTVRKTVIGVTKTENVTNKTLEEAIESSVENEKKEENFQETKPVKTEVKKSNKKVKDNSSEQISMAEIPTEIKEKKEAVKKDKKPAEKKVKADMKETKVSDEEESSEMLIKPVKSGRKRK